MQVVMRDMSTSQLVLTVAVCANTTVTVVLVWCLAMFDCGSNETKAKVSFNAAMTAKYNDIIIV